MREKYVRESYKKRMERKRDIWREGEERENGSRKEERNMKVDTKHSSSQTIQFKLHGFNIVLFKQDNEIIPLLSLLLLHSLSYDYILFIHVLWKCLPKRKNIIYVK